MNKILKYSLVLVVLLSIIDSTWGLTFQVEPKQQECFYNYVEGGKTSLILYQVIRGGLLDIDIRIFDPKGNTIFSRLHFDTTMKGRQSFTAAESGAYKLCFNNEMSRFTAKVITFTWNLEEFNPNEYAKGATLNPMEHSIQKIERVLQSVVHEQKRLRYREQANRDTSESTNGRVVWWSIGEVAILVVMGVAQIWYLRKWFDSRSTGRV
ncbi:hypothetical protein DLAC_11497 [Tieghemostelium lacteum]|uniref:GOLD domain-containing protein n=1 Tax=Tieghemostelium lacteum TaxID=361077 RepID=A0A152A758_TIELA|nr:hypothetical protein DLAC_11497 [Tieghemostelium lacteum]|eukprot:KYR01887.1 hypothetical protein DLAC_11497 [Tieghemostelium lacteum]